MAAKAGRAAGKVRDHIVLFDRLSAALAGEKVQPVGINGGPINKKLMDAATALIVDWSPENRKRWLGYLGNMQRTGHLAMKGEEGVAVETGCTGMHLSYSLAAVLGVYREARTPLEVMVNGHPTGKFVPGSMRDAEVAAACEAFILAEIGLDRHFRWGKGRTVVLPAPRIKDEKKQGPTDLYRDGVVALALGEEFRKPAKWWADPLCLAPRLMRELVESGVWGRELQKAAGQAPIPRLYLPIRKQEISGGWVAWIEDTPEARKAMGKDALHVVKCTTAGGIEWAYDWAPGLVPEKEEGR